MCSTAAIPGCNTVRDAIPFGGGGGSAEIASLETGNTLDAKLPTRVYRSLDRNTADIYLTDLSDDELTAILQAGPSGASGQLLHIHMFVLPKPGRTPIDDTAVTASVRYVVFSGSEHGVYAGAGFLLPAGEPGGKRFSGTMDDATLRLDRATDGFRDLLGPSRLDLSFGAERNETLAGELDDAISTFVASADPLPGFSPGVGTLANTGGTEVDSGDDDTTADDRAAESLVSEDDL